MDIDVPEITAVLVGQHDGKVFIPRQAVLAIQRMNLHIEETHDLAKDGWYVWLTPGPSTPEWAAECEEFGCHDDA